MSWLQSIDPVKNHYSVNLSVQELQVWRLCQIRTMKRLHVGVGPDSQGGNRGFIGTASSGGDEGSEDEDEDEGDPNDENDDGEPDCCFAFVDGVLVIRSDMAILRVTEVGSSGDQVCEIDLCELIAPDDPGDPDDEGDEDEGDDGEQATCDGDVTNDLMVDVDDILAIVTHWGSAAEGEPCDIDQDGRVDVSDIMFCVLDWGACDE